MPYRQPLGCPEVAVPLSVIGVTLGLLVTGTPFSFMVFIGVVSLTGIVVNDGIVMIDAVNRLRRAGMPLADAVSGHSRFRPVLLTTVTTIAGIGEGGEFWVPLGVAVISGLLVASTMTLFLVPVLYTLFEGPRADRR
jgi:HAE1 family hydrophobic/amphiphilic exporter-1